MSDSTQPESTEPESDNHDAAIVANADELIDDSAANSNDGNVDIDSGRSETETETSDDDSKAEVSPRHTALQCLALVARHHGIDVSADRLIHDYSLEETEPTLNRVMRIAKDVGFKTRFVRLTWQHFAKVNEAFPLMIRLQNGNYIIAVGLRKHEKEDGTTVDQVAVYDPLADRPDFIFLEQAEFESQWKGEAVFLKRKFSMLDSNQPFSLTWFVPEIFKQRTAFTDVAVAAFFIHVIALVVPLYFQIVIDKVLVNYALSTLQVLTVGIVIALAFD